LNKPIYPTVAACFEILRTNVKSRPAQQYRSAYLSHIQRFWRTMQDASGFSALKKIQEMIKIESQYVQKRENNFEQDIPEDTVVLPGHVLDSPTQETPSVVRFEPRSAPRMGFSGGRFQVRR
jgi:ribosomal protein L18E